MNSEIKQLIQALWTILPAYTANGAPIIATKITEIFGFKKHPIDGGRMFIDGRRMFGDNKTWEGFIAGIIVGVLTSIIQTFFEASVSLYSYSIRGIALGFGAMVGDLLGAFIKRRLGLKPGAPLPLIDQLSFLLVAIAISLKFINITFKQFIYVAVTTIVLHITTNYLAYKLGLKNVPW
ncbi:MAG: CDP-2,3-bis-(O-geranylgeranyl)-sn-glycerol synthase [Ignisphaera sp.]|uniref:CDP-archaeol synthase n=1 Tax=Ignisphaera aggregans TaxID=334771 RepID=A0A7J3N0B5_9CREN